jgi:hypothetical protein
MVGANGSNDNNGSNGKNGDHAARVGTIRVKQGLAQMLKGGVIVRTFNRIDMRTPIFCDITISNVFDIVDSAMIDFVLCLTSTFVILLH